MGLRFRKSMKIAPGVKLNLNKKSAGMTLGGKGINYTVNTKGTRTSSIGLPGTGVYYTDIKHSEITNTNNSKKSNYSAKSFSSTESINDISNTQTTSNTGCLIKCLKYFLYLCLLCTIPIVFITGYILKKVYPQIKFDTEKNKKYCKVLFIIIFVIAIIYSLPGSEPTPLESITLSIDSSGVELDMEESHIIYIDYTPADADIADIEVVFDSSFLSVKLDSNSVSITSLNNEGDSKLSIVCGDISSNSISIEVIDYTRIEEERLAEEKRLAEEERLAEEKRIADEKAAQEKDEYVQMVWIPSSGSKYHRKSSCSSMNSPSEVTIDRAKNLGFTACGRCY